MTVLATIVVLGVLIFVHELGHFWAAKAVGIEVQRFSIGLGPRLFGFTRGETEYVISAIPLGGYVKMGGMDDEVMEAIEGGSPDGPKREPSDRDFDAKPIWARTLVISAGVIMNMLFAFAVYTGLAATYGESDLDTTRVGRVLAESLPTGAEALAGVEEGSRFLAIGGEATRHWGDVQLGLFEAEPGPLTLEFADPASVVEIIVPSDQESRRQLALSVLEWREAGVGALDPGGPASSAGLEAGDRFLSIDGEATPHWWRFQDVVKARPGERVIVRLDREGTVLERAATLDSVEEENPDGTTSIVGRLGVYQPSIESVYTPVPFREALAVGYRETAAVTGLIAGFLGGLFTGQVPLNSVGSIVTIGDASGQAAAAGFDVFLRFMALFSVNLAILNLLPIPVLDGGHLVFLAIEAVRGGRALSVEQRLRWSNVGFIVIVGLMLLAIGNDFVRYGGQILDSIGF